jgi:DNA-binding CsgD family transcriptional regulator
MKRILILLLLLKTTIGQCQNQKIIDSLYKLESATTSPKEKLPILFELFKSLRYRDSIECEAIGNKGIVLSKELKNLHYESMFTSSLGGLYYYKQNKEKSITTLNKALHLATINSDDHASAHAWFKLGAFYLTYGVKDSALHYLLKAEEVFKSRNDECSFTTIIYYDLNKLYADQFLIDKAFFYSQLALEKAKQCNNDDATTFAYLAAGLSNFRKFEVDEKQYSNYADSAIFYYKSILKIERSKSSSNKDVIANTYFNIGVTFYKMKKKETADSVFYYFNACEQMGKNTTSEVVLCMMQLAKCKLFLEKGELAQVKTLLSSIEQNYSSLLKEIENASDYYEVKYKYAKLTGDLQGALKYKELESIYKDSTYSSQKAAITQRTETEFKNYKQEQQLNEATQQIATKKKLNYFYLALAAISIIGLGFMFLSYFYRKRDYIKTNLLLQKEKKEAELLAQFKEEEAMNAIMEKELAEQERLVAIQEKLLTEAQKDKLQQELMTNQLQLDRKNDFLKELKQKLPQLNITDDAGIKKITKTLDRSMEIDEEFELLKTSFENTNPKFLSNLQEKANGALSKLDLKYCGYLKIGMSNKEIASLMHIEPKSMRMVKYRIKQKLNLSKEEDLDSFINAV